MKSLFKLADSNSFIERINKLSASSVPAWGKMSVTQMLVHSQKGFMMAVGNLSMKRGLMGILFGKMAKKQLISDKPFKRNLPTAKELLVSPLPENVEEEKRKLVELVIKFQKAGPDGVSKTPHAFFGKLTPEEWDLLQTKHLDHHLEQFGV